MIMSARYSANYIDKIFSEEDLPSIYQAIEVVAQHSAVPEEFWLFCRIYEWAPSRSGVWQYYENLPGAKFERMNAALERSGLNDVAQRYQSGKNAWQNKDEMRKLDLWLEENAARIHKSLLALIGSQKDLLKSPP